MTRSSLLARGALATALVVLAIGGAAPAYAGGHGGGHFGGSPSGPSSATITGTQTTTTTTPGHSGSTGVPTTTSSAGSAPSIPFYGPTPATVARGTLDCNPASYGPGGYSSTFALPAPCIQPTAAPAKGPKAPAAPVITTQMVVDAAQVVAPTSPPHVEPGTISFVNIPNNYWTDAGVVHTAVTVLGRSIPLTWTPTATTWNFGDGSTGTGNGIEGAGIGAPGSVEHAYAQQGSYAITTATTYTLAFVLPGQGAQTITLTSPPSPPVTLPVSEIQTLVDYVS